VAEGKVADAEKEKYVSTGIVFRINRKKEGGGVVDRDRR
jgi:hypothetical protein